MQKKALEKKDAVQEDYDKAYNELNEAINGLTKKPIEKPDPEEENIGSGGNVENDGNVDKQSSKDDAEDKEEVDSEKEAGVETSDMTDVAGTAMILLASGATAAALLKKKKDANKN